MTKLIPLLLFIFLSFFGQAQTITEDSLISIMAKEACEEFEKSDLKDVTSENLDMKLGMLFINTFQKHQSEIEKIYGEDYLTDNKTLRKIGEKIGFKMGVGCKAFQTFVVKNGENLFNMDEEKGKSNLPKQSVSESSSKSINGNIVGYTKAEFSFFTLKSKGVNEKLYWINSFSGADLLINNSQAYVNKAVSFDYKEDLLFDGTKQTYKKVKIITAFYDFEKIEEVKAEKK